jgi:hypothetical protein
VRDTATGPVPQQSQGTSLDQGLPPLGKPTSGATRCQAWAATKTLAPELGSWQDSKENSSTATLGRSALLRRTRAAVGGLFGRGYHGSDGATSRRPDPWAPGLRPAGYANCEEPWT